MNGIFIFLVIPLAFAILVLTITAQDPSSQIRSSFHFFHASAQLVQGGSDNETLSVAEFPVIPSSAAQQVQQQQQQQSEDGFYSVIEKAINSSVGIISEFSTTASPLGLGVNPEFDGSGFVYDQQGQIIHIVTNEHVVSGFEEEPFYIYFQDGSRYIGNVIGTDPVADIAVLEMIYNGTQPLQPLELGNSSDLHVGEEVTAIGSPYLEPESISNLVTKGIVSKLGIEPVTGDTGSIIDAIVTDLSIHGGSSGGPLLNSQGQVVGIMTASDETPCCSYAVPSNTISRVVPVLIETGVYFHPYIGIYPVSLNADPIARDAVPPNIQGVIVSTIDRDSPAHKAGIDASTLNDFGEQEYGDIVMAIDQEPISGVDEFDAVIDRYSVGDNIDLTLYRNGEIEHVIVTLE
jgi:S1-C subfamily serine protease